MIYKVRRLQNKDIDFMCQLLNALNVKNLPTSMEYIEKQLHHKFDLKEYFKCYYICSGCNTTNVNHSKKCQCVDNPNLVEFYLYSVKQQLQQLLLITGMYQTLKREKK